MISPFVRLAFAASFVAGLSACSSPQAPRYHTLLPAAGELVPMSIPAPPLNAAWELEPVRIPAQVDQPQFAVRSADDTMALLEQERWVAPLASEIRTALDVELARRLGSADGAKLSSQQSKKPWRVRVDVQRFDSVPGRYARLEATWLLSPGQPGVAPLSCGSVFQENAADTYPALSAAHRRAMVELADAMSATLRQLDATGNATCPKSPT